MYILAVAEPRPAPHTLDPYVFEDSDGPVLATVLARPPGMVDTAVLNTSSLLLLLLLAGRIVDAK